jgi:ATP-dependent protease ClpP protease subunit
VHRGKFVDHTSRQSLGVRRRPPDIPIYLILHTPGGLVLAAMQIARAVESHKAKVTVYVPVYAMSGGTLMALAADEILTLVLADVSEKALAQVKRGAVGLLTPRMNCPPPKRWPRS